jgi:hypothetical protein
MTYDEAMAWIRLGGAPSEYVRVVGISGGSDRPGGRWQPERPRVVMLGNRRVGIVLRRSNDWIATVGWNNEGGAEAASVRSELFAAQLAVATVLKNFTGLETAPMLPLPPLSWRIP